MISREREFLFVPASLHCCLHLLASSFLVSFISKSPCFLLLLSTFHLLFSLCFLSSSSLLLISVSSPRLLSPFLFFSPPSPFLSLFPPLHLSPLLVSSPLLPLLRDSPLKQNSVCGSVFSGCSVVQQNSHSTDSDPHCDCRI